MLDKIRGILYLMPCFIVVAYHILKSRKWNMIMVDLEEAPFPSRIRYTYRLKAGTDKAEYVLEKHRRI